MITLEHLDKTFTSRGRRVRALDDVSLTIPTGSVYGVIGYSGAGKSTLLRAINHLEQPDSGRVLIDDQEVGALSRAELNTLRRKVGMIFQQFNLLASATVADNVAMPMLLAGWKKPAIRKRVGELLGYVGLADKAGNYPAQLSGGQKQRVGIARALALEPKVLLCDEATSALDPETTTAILDLLRRINQDLGITIVVVTHEMHVISSLCHEVAVMSGGRVVEHGPVLDVFARPREPITRSFVRTIIDDQVPRKLADRILADPEPGEVLRMVFRGAAAESSAIGEINKNFGVLTNLLEGSVHEIDGEVLGVHVLQVKGSPAEIAAAKQHLLSRQVSYDVIPLEELRAPRDAVPTTDPHSVDDPETVAADPATDR